MKTSRGYDTFVISNRVKNRHLCCGVCTLVGRECSGWASSTALRSKETSPFALGDWSLARVQGVGVSGRRSGWPSTSSPRGPLFPRASLTGWAGARGQLAVSWAQVPASGPHPPGWRHSRAVGREKAGQGSANPKQGGAAPISSPLPSLQACLFQLFKQFQSTRTPATFGKRLNPTGGERWQHSPEGQTDSGDRGATGAFLRHSACPQPPETPARNSLPPQDGQLLASAPARVGDFRKVGPGGWLGKEGPWALAPPSRGGRRSGTRARSATPAKSGSSEFLGSPRSRRRHQYRRVRSKPRQPEQGRRRGASKHRPQLSMMDLELPPPGLPSQQVVPGREQGRKGAAAREGQPHRPLSPSVAGARTAAAAHTPEPPRLSWGRGRGVATPRVARGMGARGMVWLTTRPQPPRAVGLGLGGYASARGGEGRF